MPPPDVDLEQLPTHTLRAILSAEQANIRVLNAQISVSEQKINRIKTILSPFSRLPQEIISEIFLFYCDIQGLVYNDFQKRNARTRPSKLDPERVVDGINTIPPQLILTQVSSFWRAVAHETRALWSTLIIYVQSGKFPYHQDLILEWLDHSGSLPLDIHIFVPKSKGQTTKSLLDSIAPFSNRLRRLEISAPLQTLRTMLISAPIEAPMLEHVRMDVCHITESSMRAYETDKISYMGDDRFTVFDNAPKLHSFACKVSFDPSHDHEILFDFLDIIPYKQITDLVMEGDAYVPSPNGGLRFMASFTENLVSCSVQVPNGVHYEEEPLPLTFPRLRSLSVSVASYTDLPFFLQQLTTPSLNSMKLKMPGEIMAVGLDTFLELTRMQARSSFVLEELVLEECAKDTIDLFRFLLTANSLQRLTVYENRALHLNHVISWLAYQRISHLEQDLQATPDVLPNLTELRLHSGKLTKINCNDKPVDGLANLIAARGRLAGVAPEDGSSSRKLELLEVQITETALQSMDEAELEILDSSRDLGFKLGFSLWLADGTLHKIGDHC